MRTFIRGTVCSIAAVVVAIPVSAQEPTDAERLAAQGGSISLSPYVGMVMPTADLLTLAKTSGPGTQDIKLSSTITLGGRLGVMFSSRVGILADVGYSPGSLKFDSTGVSTNTDVTVLSGVGKLVIFLIPSTSPVWLNVSGGGGAIRHSFKNQTGTLTGVKDGTSVGGVIGTSAGIRLGQLIALTGTVEDYLYSAQFENGTTKTSEKKQHDVRITGGIRIPILGM